MSFQKLPLNPAIHKALSACGYTQPTPVQAKAIPEILAGKDVLACAQTGTGKTAAFVLPALNYLSNQKKPSKKPRVLVLTPTRELATQITKASTQYGKFLRYNIVSLVGGMPYERQIRDLQRGADIVVATPGRLMDHMENKRIDLSQVDILVLDEADRMLDMGFIDDVEAIARKTPSSRQTLLFSATLDKSLLKIVKRLLNKPVHIDLSQKDLAAPNIKQSLYRAKNMGHKSRMLRHFLNDENIYKAIIFSATKSHADKLAKELRADGFAAAPLHGDLRQNVRNRTIEQLRRGKVQFLVATDVAARGIDISDITHVINYDLPRFSEDYVHRIGRTGRAGKSGEAISFCTSADIKHVSRIERYIGKRLKILSDNFTYGDLKNERSDADKFPPEAMFERSHQRGSRNGGRSGGRSGGNSGRSGGERHRSRRSNDEGFSKSSYGSRKPRRGDDRFEKPAHKSSRPRRSFDDGETNIFERPSYDFSESDRDSKPRVSYKKSNDKKPSRGKFSGNRSRDEDSERKPSRRKFSGNRSRDEDSERKPSRRKFSGNRSRDEDSDRKPSRGKFSGNRSRDDDSERKPSRRKFSGNRSRDEDSDKKPKRGKFSAKKSRDGAKPKRAKSSGSKSRDGGKKSFEAKKGKKRVRKERRG